MEIANNELLLEDESLEVLPEIKILEKVYDKELTKTYLKIFIGDPYFAIVYKSGGLARICFQLVEQFSLPISHKALAEILNPQLVDAKFRETSVEDSLYYSFHSWLLEKGTDFFAKGQMWYVTKDEKRYVRATSEPMRAFFMAQGIVDRKSREGVLQYWREKKWLNPGGAHRLNKNVKITLPDGTKGWIQVYEILISEDLPADEEEVAPLTSAAL